MTGEPTLVDKVKGHTMTGHTYTLQPMTHPRINFVHLKDMADKILKVKLTPARPKVKLMVIP